MKRIIAVVFILTILISGLLPINSVGAVTTTEVNFPTANTDKSLLDSTCGANDAAGWAEARIEDNANSYSQTPYIKIDMEGTYNLERAFIYVDTSSLPDNAIIYSANLEFTATSTNESGTPVKTLRLLNSTDTNNTIETTDFSSFNNTHLAPATTITTDGSYVMSLYNFSPVSLTGYTKLVIVSNQYDYVGVHSPGVTWTCMLTDVNLEILYYTDTIEVSTLTYEIFPNNYAKMGGYIKNLPNGDTADCYIQWGLATGVYGNVVDCGTLTGDGGINTSYRTNTIAFDPTLTIYYRAFVVYEDVEYTGSEVSFSISEDIENVNGISNLIKTLNVSKITFSSVNFNVLLISTGPDTSLDLTVVMGTDGVTFGTEVTILDGAAAAGTYTANKTGLTPNTKYYYRAKAVGSNSGTTYGAIKEFKTYDAEKSGFVNFLDGWFDSIGFGAGGWWLVVLLLMVAVWFIPGIRQIKILPVCLDIFILGMSLALGIIDLWLIVLLALGAGVYVFKAIFSPG